jgi:hypothetical protein
MQKKKRLPAPVDLVVVVDAVGQSIVAVRRRNGIVVSRLVSIAASSCQPLTALGSIQNTSQWCPSRS